MELFYKTRRRYKHDTAHHEENTAPSETVPGETMTMRELLARYQEGLDPVRSQIQYFDVPEIDEINRFFAPGNLDLTDIDQLNENVERLQGIVEKAHTRAVKERDQAKKQEIEEKKRQKQEYEESQIRLAEKEEKDAE